MECRFPPVMNFIVVIRQDDEIRHTLEHHGIYRDTAVVFPADEPSKEQTVAFSGDYPYLGGWFVEGWRNVRAAGPERLIRFTEPDQRFQIPVGESGEVSSAAGSCNQDAASEVGNTVPGEILPYDEPAKAVPDEVDALERGEGITNGLFQHGGACIERTEPGGQTRRTDVVTPLGKERL